MSRYGFGPSSPYPEDIYEYTEKELEEQHLWYIIHCMENGSSDEDREHIDRYLECCRQVGIAPLTNKGNCLKPAYPHCADQTKHRSWGV